ncbi:MAG: hypothetical protein ACI8Q1_002171 [Parvicella sp.]|jgi:hypothetical protein
MRTLKVIILTILLSACNHDSPESYELSGYARIVDEQLNMDLEKMVMYKEDPAYELNELMKEAIKIVIEQTGGYDLTGELIHGKQEGKAFQLLNSINFYPRLNNSLNDLKSHRDKYDYLIKGLYLIKSYWLENEPEKLTNGEVLMGLTIAHNRVLTSTLIK